MYFSFGLLFKKLLLRKHPNVANYELCNALFKAIEPQFKGTDTKEANKYLSCKTELPELISTAASCKTIFDIALGVEKCVMPLLEPSSEKKLILSLREDLKNDTSLDNSSKVGDYTKSDLLKASHFVFSLFLASVIVLAVTRSNRKGLDDVTKVNSDFSFTDEELNTIVIVPLNGNTGGLYTLSPSLNVERFYSVFREFSPQELKLMNIQSSAKFFYLPTETFQFDYTGLVRYLKGIATSYVFSRAEITKHQGDVEEFSSCVNDAFSTLAHYKIDSHLLGEMLIYSFIECVLKAPKIMSCIEQNQFYPEKNIKWEGVHLLYLPNESRGKRYQLVFGSSTLDDDLHKAVDGAFYKLNHYVPAENKKVNGILDIASLKIPYTDELKNFLKSVLNPPFYNNSRTPVRVQSAYGVFIGFSFKIGGEKYFDDESYQVALENKMKLNIEQIIPYINKKLEENKLLAKSSVNFYFVPFNDVLEDSQTIILDMLRS